MKQRRSFPLLLIPAAPVMKKTVSNVCRPKILRKFFCSETVKVAASTDFVPSNEHEKKPIVSEVIPEYDIAIVGGGMVGMSLACFLGIFLQWVYVWSRVIDSGR